MRAFWNDFKAGLAKGVGFFVAALACTGLTAVLAQSLTSFASGDLISASSINANFTTLYDLITNRTLGISSSSGNWSQTGGLVGSYMDVPNLTVSVTTNGNPLMIMLVPDSAGASRVHASGNDTTQRSRSASLRLMRDGSMVGEGDIGATANSLGGAYMVTIAAPPGAFVYYDAPSAGTYTYSVQIGNTPVGSNHVVLVRNCRLLVKYL